MAFPAAEMWQPGLQFRPQSSGAGGVFAPGRGGWMRAALTQFLFSCGNETVSTRFVRNGEDQCGGF